MRSDSTITTRRNLEVLPYSIIWCLGAARLAANLALPCQTAPLSAGPRRHLFHESCLTGGALRSCALCRAPVRPDRIRPASQVPGARSPSGTIVDNWAQRSGALLPGLLAAPKQAPAASLPRPAHQAPRPPAGPAAGSAGHGGQRRLGGHSDAVPEATSPMPEALLERLASWQASVGPRVWGPPPQARQLGEPASGASGQQRPRSRCPADPLAATDIPPLDSAALLEGICLQLGAAAAAGGAAAGQPGAARLPSTFAFCLDISSACRQPATAHAGPHPLLHNHTALRMHTDVLNRDRQPAASPLPCGPAPLPGLSPHPTPPLSGLTL